MILASGPSLEKGRPAGLPGAKSAGSETHGNVPREDLRTVAFGEQSTKTRDISPRNSYGSLPLDRRWKTSVEKARSSSAFWPLTTQELTREVQGVVLNFRTTEIVEDTQASLRAIEDVRNGKSGMSLKTFVNLCRANPRARAMIGPMLGFGLESDPEVVNAISVLMNKLARDGVEAPEARQEQSPALGRSGCVPGVDEEVAIGDLFTGDEA